MVLDHSADLDELCGIAQGWHAGGNIEFIAFAQGLDQPQECLQVLEAVMCPIE